MLRLLLCLGLFGCTSVKLVGHENCYGEDATVSVILPCGHTVIFQLVDGAILSDQPDLDTIKSLDKKRN